MKYILIIVICLTAITNGHAQNEKFKALFIYKFIQNLEWPAGEVNANYVIGITGNDVLKNELESMTKQRSVNGKPIEIKEFSSGSNVRDYNMVFLSKGRAELFESLKSDASKSATVLVSDTPGLAKKGASLNFITTQGKLKFEMNLDAIESSNISVSSSLKALAILVN